LPLDLHGKRPGGDKPPRPIGRAEPDGLSARFISMNYGPQTTIHQYFLELRSGPGLRKQLLTSASAPSADLEKV
jgi:hypothetical protein